jgi:AAA domain-containing protein
VLVTQQPGVAGQEDSSSAEVQLVVEQILEHARTRPDQSLGVITMGIKHANRITETLRQARAANPQFEVFFDESLEEAFFTKNLERVQGDERDAIILSVGYGKTPDGRLLYRFGPLLQQGGERRLNVAITRAKQHMTLVSSFAHTDMDPSRSQAEGVHLLAHYLEYAASRGSNPGRAALTIPELNPFEISVRDALTSAGIPLLPSTEHRATASTSPPATQPNPAAWSWPSNATVPATTPPPPHATVTGSAKTNWKPSAGASTGSGRPTGSTTKRPKSLR